MSNRFVHTYEDIISIENLLAAWEEFTVGKRGRIDVQEFGLNLMSNIFALRRDLVGKTYVHSPYHAFNISDPKPRNIHKAAVSDRLLHHAVYRMLYPYFDARFIADSFSCRLGKGTHRALDRFRSFANKVSLNHIRTVWVLKCDIRKFFANIDHTILLGILGRSITDKDIKWLLGRIVGSFSSTRHGVGLPLGNLTSQLFVNIYMNEFDQFVKKKLHVKHYVRYADDFVFLSEDRSCLIGALTDIANFLGSRLRLSLHPDKVFIQTFASGVDFLGWTHFPDHRVLRTTTKRRMMNRISEGVGDMTKASYLGLLIHGNAFEAQQKISNTPNIIFA